MARVKQRFKNFRQTITRTENIQAISSIPIDRIISKEQVRKTFENIEELAESIKQHGLFSPIIVSQVNEQGKHTIIQGERRWRACKLAGFSNIDAIVRQEPNDESNRTIVQLTENIQREDMTCEEIATAIAKLHDEYGKTLKEISKSLGKSESWADVYYAIAVLPEHVKAIRDEHQIKDATSLRSLKKMFEIDEAIAKETIEKAINNKIPLTRSTITGLLTQVKARLDGIGRINDAKETTATPERTQYPTGCKPSNDVRVYCWCLLPGKEGAHFGYIATDIVSEDHEFVCVVINETVEIVSHRNVVIAGVKDKADPVNDLL